MEENVKKRKKRSATKKITKESLVLRFMRKSKNLSMRKAATLIGVSESLVSFIEHGRVDINQRTKERFLEAYGYSDEEFELFSLSDESDLTDHRDELINLINKMSDDQVSRSLKMIMAIVRN